MFKPQFNKRNVLVFHQFKRKGYALFACLGREVVISVLSVATLSSAKADSISDETFRADSTKATAREVMLNDISITGSRAPLTMSQAARMVTVLSHDDIAQAPVQSINDLLKTAIGIDVRQRGALGSQTDISIRGGTNEQITILLNGINICDPQTGHNALDLPCDLNDIVRIEVLEGPAGRIYGTSSLVGAINIVTANPHPLPKRGDLYAEGGSYGYSKIGGNISLPAFGIGSSLSASYTRSDGYSHSKGGHRNTDYQGTKAFYQGGYGNEAVKVNWHVGMSDRGWGSGTFYATPKWQADEQYEHTTKVFTAMQGENLQGTLHLQPALYWNHQTDHYEGYRGRPDIMKYNYNQCNVYGIKLNTYFDWAWGRTALGSEIRNEDLISGNLGEPLSHPRRISGTDRQYTLGINRTNISAHLEHNILLSHLTISAGLVAAKSSWSDMDLRLYPGIDMSYKITDDQQNARSLKLFASYNTSLRLPSFTEMYYHLQGYAADPHLKPEEMQAVEAGAQYHSPQLQAKVTLWHHHGRNMIDWIYDAREGDDARWKSVNHTRLNANGIDAYIHADLGQRLNHTAISLSYCYITQDKEQEPFIVSQYALEYLRHKLVAQMSIPLWQSLKADMSMRWQDRVGTYTDFAGQVNRYRPYTLVDAKITWHKPRYEVYAKASNLFNNRSYTDYGNVPQPGLWLVGGVKWQLPF